MLSIRVILVVALVGATNFAAARGVAAQAAQVGQSVYRVGDRVNWDAWGVSYVGTVYEVQGDRYRIERDGYGRAVEWVTASVLQRLPGTGSVAPPVPRPIPVEPPRTPPVVETPPTAHGSFNVGDRVEWLVGETWYAGIVYGSRGAEYQINRDNFGRAREWETPANLRRMVQQIAEQPVAGPARGEIMNGERVEVNVGGTWYRGNVGSGDPRADRYVVDRENGGDASSVTVRASQLRRLAPATADVPRAALPKNIPTGLYECQLYLANGAIMGRLRIVNGNSYTGLSANGAGPASRFDYDQTTGKIDWIGGMRGFKPTVQSSLLQSNPRTPQANGGATPFIVVHYQLREGGNINSMSCGRIGG